MAPAEQATPPYLGKDSLFLEAFRDLSVLAQDPTWAFFRYCAKLKTAPTVALSVIVTLQTQDSASDSLLAVVHELGSGTTGTQLAENPPNFDPVDGLAVRVTGAPSTKCPVQPPPEPQLIPPGELTTFPVPWPKS